MIINSGLGNTIQDVGNDINSGNYNSIPNDLMTGLANGDGWAYMLTITGAYLLWKLLLAPKRAVEQVKRVKLQSPVNLSFSKPVKLRAKKKK